MAKAEERDRRAAEGNRPGPLEGPSLLPPPRRNPREGMRDKELQMGGPSVGRGALFLPSPPDALEGTQIQQGYEKQWCLLSVPTGWGPETASQRFPRAQSGVGRVFCGLGRGARPNTEPFLETPWVGCPLADRAAQWRSPRSTSMPDRVPEEDAEAGAHRDCENLMPSCSRGQGAYVHVECRIMTVKFCASVQKS